MYRDKPKCLSNKTRSSAVVYALQPALSRLAFAEFVRVMQVHPSLPPIDDDAWLTVYQLAGSLIESRSRTLFM